MDFDRGRVGVGPGRSLDNPLIYFMISQPSAGTDRPSETKRETTEAAAVGGRVRGQRSGWAAWWESVER